MAQRLCRIAPLPDLVQGPSSSGVEQRIENPRVGGSNPPSGTIFSKFHKEFLLVHCTSANLTPR